MTHYEDWLDFERLWSGAVDHTDESIAHWGAATAPEPSKVARANLTEPLGIGSGWDLLERLGDLIGGVLGDLPDLPDLPDLGD